MFLNTLVYAGWSGPIEILSGGWGSNTGQFAIDYGDSGDTFPKLFCVSSGNFIAIADELTSRVQVFSNVGTFMAAFGPKNIPESEGWQGGWPARLGCMSNAVYTEFDKYTQLYNTDGSLIKGWNNLQGGLVSILSNDNFITNTSTNYYLYSPTGQLINTYTTRPPELGVVKETPLGNDQYKITVTYPDRTWSYVGAGAVSQYMRDMNGNLYCQGRRQAIRWNFCGKEIARLTMPQKNITKSESDIPGMEPTITVLEEYGSPVLAPNGNVYTWKRTPSNYSIVKWTWVDDPNTPTGPDAPANLKVAASTTGLYLTWTASPQDPGCVTGYEISRSTTSGSSYSVIATVDKGVLNYNDTTTVVGTTYYYKLRAKSGTDFSAYTAEASGSR